jgi:hypothetical protein
MRSKTDMAGNVPPFQETTGNPRPKVLFLIVGVVVWVSPDLINQSQARVQNGKYRWALPKKKGEPFLWWENRWVTESQCEFNKLDSLYIYLIHNQDIITSLWSGSYALSMNDNGHTGGSWIHVMMRRQGSPWWVEIPAYVVTLRVKSGTFVLENCAASLKMDEHVIILG